MEAEIRIYQDQDIPKMIEIWNEIVDEGIAFPQEDFLDDQSGRDFFETQTTCGVAVVNQEVVGLYILHPNNVGRCGHICNASYAIKKEMRGLHIGEKLVMHSLEEGKRQGFQIMQFNAVVKNNIHARHLYERIGFVPLGIIPKGFRLKDGRYEDICPYYYVL